MTPRVILPQAAVWLLTLLFQVACCSIQVTSASYERRCVWMPHRKAPTYKAPKAAPSESLDLRWEPRLGVYALPEVPCHYFRLGRYYRRPEGQWEAAPAIEGPWSPVAASELPPGLRKSGVPEADCDGA